MPTNPDLLRGSLEPIVLEVIAAGATYGYEIARAIGEASQGKLLAQEKDLWPNKNFSLTLVVTTPQYLAKHPEVIEKILSVHVRLTHWLTAQPQNWATPLE